MVNMRADSVKMPRIKLTEQVQTFKEIELGYTLEMAKEEASRCLNCKHRPCQEACPAHVKIPEFIQLILDEKLEEAYWKIQESSMLCAICSRVCPQENQCEGHCTRGIKSEPVSIGDLERFVADYYRTHASANETKKADNHHKVAVIGSGPAGLSCAYNLAKEGYDVTIFDSYHKLGGVLEYGIPKYRLPSEVLDFEKERLKNLGVKFELNHTIGKETSIYDLKQQGFESIFIGIGTGYAKMMKIENEDSNGVYRANDFLAKLSNQSIETFLQTFSSRPLKNIIIIGGGNVAMDTARSAKRLPNTNVTIVYRRSMNELPARIEEIELAQEENVKFEILCNPIKILKDEDGWVKGIVCQKMQLIDDTNDGRKAVKAIEGSEFTIEADCVIEAIGSILEPSFKNTSPQIQLNEKGNILVDENFQTSVEGIYAGGDAVTGAKTVVSAMVAGKKAAQSIHTYLSSK